MTTMTLTGHASSMGDGRTAWWPSLYLRKGKQLQLITPEQCPKLREIYNDGRGASEVGADIRLHNEAGEVIGHVSYNGRVWLHDIDGNKEIPVGSRMTTVEREKIGWAEFCAFPISAKQLRARSLKAS